MVHRRGVQGTHKVALIVTAQQTIFLFGNYLDEGLDIETMLMRKRCHFKLTKQEFISALGGPGNKGVWHKGCGRRSKTAFISEKKPVSLTFLVNSPKQFHNHAGCLRCATEILDPSRPCDCNTKMQDMKSGCSLKISIPWGTGVRLFSEPIYDALAPKVVY